MLNLSDLFLSGPRRFSDFEESLTGMAPNTLSARIKGLEGEGVIARRLYSEHPPRAEYFLTDKGKALGPVLLGPQGVGKALRLKAGKGLGHGLMNDAVIR